MLRQLERVLKLDMLLRAGHRQTAPLLAEALEVSERTVRADICFLKDRFQAPIVVNRKRGFHYTDPEWRLPSIPLTKGELFALTLGSRMLEAYAGSAYAPQLRSAIARLAERIPEQEWLDLQQVADDRFVFRSGAETHLDLEIWQQLEDACREKKRVWMRYRTASRRDDVSERELDPYLLHIYRGTNPYVIGWCHKRQEVRWFRVDRILSLKTLRETFEVDPTFDPKDHLAMIFQHEVGGIPQQVGIWFDAQTAPFIRERRWHPTQVIEEEPDGSLVLRMTVQGMNDVKRWVLGYGKGAVVRDPPELMEMIKAEIVEMNMCYSRS
ncbi:MAG: WYL domain-containing protein [Cyanobacteriota bacterium]|nr:WYL domain-containing protein [Cyanobacteriota bacterium]